jgi:hypothetical protein
MVGGMTIGVDGSWVCNKCVATARVKARYEDVKLTIIPCPACSRTGMIATCLVCNKLGSVKVPDSEIRILSTAQMPTVLTEG